MYPFFSLLSSIPLFFFLFNLPIPTFCQDKYNRCNNHSFSCGAVQDIRYPFWGGVRADYCGHPNFKLDCQDDTPTIMITFENYKILSIDPDSRKLKIARTDSLTGSCPTQLSTNTPAFNYTIFNISDTDTRNLTWYYDCPPKLSKSINNFSCEYQGLSRTCLFSTRSKPLEDTYEKEAKEACRFVTVSPIAGTDFTKENDLIEILKKEFQVQYTVDLATCHTCTESRGECGYNKETLQPTCFCKNGDECAKPKGSVRGKVIRIGSVRGKVIRIGIAGIVGTILTVGTITFCCLSRKSITVRALWQSKAESAKAVEAFLKDCALLTPKRYKYKDVKKMTSAFKDKIGQGGYGSVFKGTLPDGNTVAVKILSEKKGNGNDFINEVASISRTSHVNIVTLIGFCVEEPKRALVYEFMPNGSLEKFIFEETPSKTHHQLCWETLYKIAIGIARGLEYLHRGCGTRIVHFDIKPHNILLDKNFNPKIADFGLSKLCHETESVVSMTRARGTAGYIAPEVVSRNFGVVSHKSDVYSYGMMVLEMVGGRRNIDVRVSNISEIYFPHWVYKRLNLNEDLSLHGVTSLEDQEIAQKMILVGLWCIQIDPQNRPPMSRVLDMLAGRLEDLEIPPNPFPSSPLREEVS